jgi:hypothetical protein
MPPGLLVGGRRGGRIRLGPAAAEAASELPDRAPEAPRRLGKALAADDEQHEREQQQEMARLEDVLEHLNFLREVATGVASRSLSAPASACRKLGLLDPSGGGEGAVGRAADRDGEPSSDVRRFGSSRASLPETARSSGPRRIRVADTYSISPPSPVRGGLAADA